MTEDDAIAFSARLPPKRDDWPVSAVARGTRASIADLERSKPPVKRGYGAWVVLTVLGVLAVIVAFSLSR